jgi:hypothetical protein
MMGTYAVNVSLANHHLANDDCGCGQGVWRCGVAASCRPSYGRLIVTFCVRACVDYKNDVAVSQGSRRIALIVQMHIAI